MVAAQAQRAGTRAVIVGAGPAGDAAAAGLRDGGFAGEIVLVGWEAEAPYERPHLSKGFLSGAVPRDKLPLRPAVQYRELEVELRLGERVFDLGLEDRVAKTEKGRLIAWDLLCVATGSTSRVMEGLEDAIYLRSLEQAESLRRVVWSRMPMRILGAGFIGCEVAAVAVREDREVHVFEAMEQPLRHVLGPELGAYLAALHRSHGVDLHLRASTEEADLVAIGSLPRVMTGLEEDGGILVDELGRTSTPGVFAAGDVTRFYHPLYERHIRVEHFQTAQRQGFAVGRTMAGAAAPYDEVPWFWSDQYDVNLQYVGAGMPWDEVVVRGALGSPPFTVFYLSGGRLVAAAGVNDHHTVARVRRVMQARRAVTKSQLEDPKFDLRLAVR